MMPTPPRSTPAATASTNRIGRFYIVREIGRGGLGVVYLARDPVIDRNVAIKTLSARLTAVEKKKAEPQFVNEARAAGRLCHPNIVTIHDACIEGGVTYLIMEYLEGTELSRMLDSGRIFPPSEIASIIRKLAEALAYAHKNEVVHRDIKPGNIFMLAGNQPKIFDFGIARAPNRVQDEQTSDDEPFTLFQNNLVGTPNYMSPEQATGRPVDHLTDIYSLGAVMYEMLAHRRPFQSDTTEAVLEAIAYKAPQAPHELNKAIPPALSQIAMKAMSKRPEKRYQTAEEFALDLGRFLALDKRLRSKVSTSRSDRERIRKRAARARSPLVAGGIALAVLLAVGAYLWLR